MSLDVYLYYDHETLDEPIKPLIFICRNGRLMEISREEWDKEFPGVEPVVSCPDSHQAFWANITHNLGMMAQAAGIYQALWRPEEEGYTTAKQLIEPLTVGLQMLKASPEMYKGWEPVNGWGNYEGLVNFVETYLEACKRFPNAKVSVSR